jgi:anti-sigma factor RsiW
MDLEAQLKLQAFLDGELPEKEAREVASWLARDTEATDLFAELRHTRRALANFEPRMKVPESREFYWSKIEKEIQRLEPEEPAPRGFSAFGLLRWLLRPALVAACLAVIGMVAGRQFGLFGVSRGPDTEMTVADSGTFTYHDYASGTTLVWLTYPAESEFAKGAVR